MPNAVDESSQQELSSNDEDCSKGILGGNPSNEPLPQFREDAVLEEYDVSIAKSLLLLAPPPSCRETRRLQNGVKISSLKESYDRILCLTKATNKELIHYLSVIGRYAHDSLDCEKLSNLKFTSQDKYLSQVIYVYFTLVDRYYHQMTKEQRLSIFHRYMYLFSSHISTELQIYNLFRQVLREDFLDLFISKQYYHNFVFLKEFLCDFSPQIKERLIKVGYEVSPFRELAYNLSIRLHLCVDWVLQRWNVPHGYTISDLFYSFDCVFYLEDVALRKFECAEDPSELIELEMLGHTECNVCGMSSSTESKIADGMRKKMEIRRCIEEFNRSGQIIEPLSVSNIRLFPSVDLKILGDFLGKEDNYGRIVEFAETFEFGKANILDSLRVFLKSFVLSGESQIIDRIVIAFTTVYVKQNLALSPECAQCDIAAATDWYKKVAYGFIVLNTMLYNPSFDKKPSFEDYLDLLGFSEAAQKDLPFCPLDRESLRGYYESIKESEMRLPTVWADSFDKYVLFLKVRDSTSPYSRERNIQNGICSHICDSCVKLAYRHLFKTSLSSFMSLSPKSFFRICRLLEYKSGFEYYIAAKKRDLEKSLESYLLYLECFSSSASMIGDFLDCIERTEKPRASVFNDIKSMFSRSSVDMKDRTSSTLSQFLPIVDSIGSIRFVSQDVCTANCKLLSAAMKERRPYVQAICTHIIVENAGSIGDFDGIDEESLLKIISISPEYIDRMPDRVKVLHFKKEFREERLSKESYEAFMQINLFNQDSFDAYCLAQHKFDDFDRIVKICRTEDNGREYFDVLESYSQCMKDPQNILQFLTTSPSVLNIRVAKRIHKDSCPLNDPVFNDIPRILYLILKCDVHSRPLFNYTSYIINYLSDSLVLLINVYESIYPVFLQIPKELTDVAVRILIRRIKAFAENSVMCCTGTKDTETLVRMKSLVQRLVHDGLTSGHDLGALEARGIGAEIVEL